MNKLVLQEGAAPAVGAAGTDVIYADSAAHTLKVSLNGAAFTTLGGATAPLTLTGSTDVVQLTVKGNATQTYTNAPVSVTNSAGNSFIKMGYNFNGANNYGGIIWLGNVTPNAGNDNYTIFSDGVDTHVNAPSGSVKIGVANGGHWQVNSSGILKYNSKSGLYSPVDGVLDTYANDGTTPGWLRNSAGISRSAINTTCANSTNMVNLSNMSLSLLAGRKYFGEMKLFAKNSNAAEGLRFDFGGGTATFNSFEFGFAATPPGTGLTLGTLTSTTFNSAIVVAVATTADAVYTIPVGLTCNVAGTIIPRMSENIAAGGTATVELNSFFYLEDTP